MSDMTSAAAIDLLDNLIGMVDDNQDSDYDTAFHMAIDALKTQAERTEEHTETHACDLISRQAAIDAILAVTGNSSVRELYEHVQEHGLSEMWSGGVNAAIDIIIALPSAQPNLDRTKISDLLEKIYSIQSVHLSVEGVLARKYYCKQLWIELFGSEDVPKWID